MKRKIIITIIGVAILAAFIINYMLNTKIRNIFDEIYYGEESIFHIPYGSSSFENIPEKIISSMIRFMKITLIIRL